MNIRPATRDDAPLLLGIIREAFQTVYDRLGLTPENFPRHATNLGPDWVLRQMDEGSRFFILEESGTPCGCAAIEPQDAQTVELRRLAVLPAHRNKGYGRALTAHVLAEGRRLGARRAVLGLWADEHELREWYERLGFRFVETVSLPDVPRRVTHMAMDL